MLPALIINYTTSKVIKEKRSSIFKSFPIMNCYLGGIILCVVLLSKQALALNEKEI